MHYKQLIVRGQIICNSLEIQWNFYHLANFLLRKIDFPHTLHVFGMNQPMPFQIRLEAIRPAAKIALVRLLSGVDRHVPLEAVRVDERPAAVVALVRLRLAVDSAMPVEVLPGTEAFPARFALVSLFIGVDRFVVLQRVEGRVGFAARFARVFAPGFVVGQDVLLQVEFVVERSCAYVAFVLLSVGVERFVVF